MNWFLKMIGGEALAAEAVKQAKKEWQQELEAAIAADEADDVQQDQDISGLRVKYTSVVSAVVELRELGSMLHNHILAVESGANDARTIAGGAYSTVQALEEKVNALESLVSETKANEEARAAEEEASTQENVQFILGEINKQVLDLGNLDAKVEEMMADAENKYETKQDANAHRAVLETWLMGEDPMWRPPGGIFDDIAGFKRRLDDLEDALIDPDEVNSTTTDA